MSSENKFKFNKFRKFFMNYFVYGLVVVVGYICYLTFSDATVEVKDKYLIYVTSFMYLGIVVAYSQISRNNDFQRRQFTMSESARFLQDNKRHRATLNEKMDYSNMVEKCEPITVEEVHELICEKNDNGYYGDKPYKMTDKGKVIRSHMISIMNNFELMAIGVLNNSLDEDIMRQGFERIIEQNYVFYSRYITHLNEDKKSKGFGDNFEWLYERWCKKGNKKATRDF